MRLALGPRNADKIGLRQTRRQFQHRPGHSDIVVVGELAQESDRRVTQWRNMSGQLGECLVVDPLDKQPEQIIEESDMLVVVTAGTVEKEGGEALQRIGALLARAVPDHVLQFGDQREGCGNHQVSVFRDQ